MRKQLIILFCITFFGIYLSFGQETLPIYTDYLTDNIYLVHPASAGIGDNGKIRLTGRKQWLNYTEAPEFQTLSFNTHFGSESAIGIILFNDQNGNFSQTGSYLTYAYHLQLDDYIVNQFSFGLSYLYLRNTLDTSSFNIPDSDINQEIYNENYTNADLGFAYRYQGLFSFFTIKNLLLSEKKIFNGQSEGNNLRRHLFSLGYQFNHDIKESIKIQPSIMAQYVEYNKTLYIDTNIKTFIPLERGEIWGGLSFRKDIEDKTIESLNYITSFVGLNYKKFIVSYIFTYQINNSIYSKGDFHQISLGFNFYKKRRNYKKASWDM